eukprot:5065353-Pleurochrysis_carterae.AAC.6
MPPPPVAPQLSSLVLTTLRGIANAMTPLCGVVLMRATLSWVADLCWTPECRIRPLLARLFSALITTTLCGVVQMVTPLREIVLMRSTGEWR